MGARRPFVNGLSVAHRDPERASHRNIQFFDAAEEGEGAPGDVLLRQLHVRVTFEEFLVDALASMRARGAPMQI